jgi:hypothetical protein
VQVRQALDLGGELATQLATLQNLLRTAQAGGRPAFRDLAGIAAAWHFGNNPAGGLARLGMDW